VRVVRVPSEEVVPAPVEIAGGPVPSLEPEFDTALPEYPLVMVAWHDAYFDFDQDDEDDTRPDYLVHTVGFLVSDGPRFVSIAQEVLPDGDGFRAVTHVPCSIVEWILPLRASSAGLASAGPA
jgi:hypothetical protein